MPWTVQLVMEKFGEDVLRDITRDINDLMCGKAGRGWKVNRTAVPESVWTKLLTQGGYSEVGIAKALSGVELLQSDAVGPFNPYTIHTLVNITANNGGPLTADELDALLRCALRYRQLIKD